MNKKPQKTPKSSIGTYGALLIKYLAEKGQFIFTTTEAKQAASHSGIPQKYITNLLMLMTQNGWINRLKRGLYVLSGPTFKNIQIHPFVIATRLISPSAISHWSALHHHGLTDQIPNVVTAFTPKKIVTPSMRNGRPAHNRRHAWIIDGIRYEYVTVREKYFFGIEHIWLNEFSRAPITDPERTVLELFISPRMFGGISEALEIINEHLSSLSIDKLVKYARKYGKISVAKRLGWALEQAGAPRSNIMPLLKIPATGYHLLDPSLPRCGPCDKRWMIQINLKRKKNK